MRRVPAPRASTAVAVVAAIVAVLAVMFPGLGFGQTNFIHGGMPTDVYTLMSEKTVPHRCECGRRRLVMPLQVEVEVPSHLLVYYSFELGGLDANERAQVNPNLDGGGEERPRLTLTGCSPAATSTT